MFVAFAHGLFASDSLPFPVSVGGQAAKAAGNYVMSVVSEGKTASILVTIK